VKQERRAWVRYPCKKQTSCNIRTSIHEDDTETLDCWRAIHCKPRVTADTSPICRRCKMPIGHRLAANKVIQPQELAREIFIGPARVAPVLKGVIDDYAKKAGITLKAAYDAENLSAAMSLVASTGGLALFPLYVKSMLTPAVVARPLQGVAPTIDLVMGYNKSSTSALLKRFLSRADEMIASVQKQISLK
jgi:LysR family hca operon transcriptional activator